MRSQLPAPGWLAAHVRAAGIALRQRRCFICNCRARRCFLKVGPAGAGAERSAAPCPCIRHACALASSPCTTMPCLRCPRTARCPPARSRVPTRLPARHEGALPRSHLPTSLPSPRAAGLTHAAWPRSSRRCASSTCRSTAWTPCRRTWCAHCPAPPGVNSLDKGFI